MFTDVRRSQPPFGHTGMGLGFPNSLSYGASNSFIPEMNSPRFYKGTSPKHLISGFPSSNIGNEYKVGSTLRPLMAGVGIGNASPRSKNIFSQQAQYQLSQGTFVQPSTFSPRSLYGNKPVFPMQEFPSPTSRNQHLMNKRQDSREQTGFTELLAAVSEQTSILKDISQDLKEEALNSQLKSRRSLKKKLTMLELRATQEEDSINEFDREYSRKTRRHLTERLREQDISEELTLSELDAGESLRNNNESLINSESHRNLYDTYSRDNNSATPQLMQQRSMPRNHQSGFSISPRYMNQRQFPTQFRAPNQRMLPNQMSFQNQMNFPIQLGFSNNYGYSSPLNRRVFQYNANAKSPTMNQRRNELFNVSNKNENDYEGDENGKSEQPMSTKEETEKKSRL